MHGATRPDQRQGVVFEDATAPSPWTLPSHASLLTGLYPRSHGLRVAVDRIPTSIPTMAALFHRSGYSTAGVVNVGLLSERRGFARGFGHYFQMGRSRLPEGDARRINAKALEWLETSPERFFLFLHYYDGHSDYRPLPEFAREMAEPYDGIASGTTAQMRKFLTGDVEFGPEDARHLSNLYDAEILQLDVALGELFDELESRGLLAKSLVILTSDHGEEFFEHGSLLHGRSVYQELVRVPLIMVGPGAPMGRRVASLSKNPTALT